METYTSNDLQPVFKIRTQQYWYVVYTMPHHEKKIFNQLIKDNINAYLPLQTVLKQWSDRKKRVIEPLFSCYLFVNIALKDYYKVLKTNGIIRYVCFDGKAVTIRESQIDTIRKLIESKIEMEESPVYFHKGDKVKITWGNLTGIDGELVMFNNKKRVLIRIEEINKSLFVNVPLSYLKLA